MFMRIIGAGLAIAVSAAAAMAAATTQNGITVECPWAEATRSGATVAPVYMELRAIEGVNRRLTGAFSDLATAGELDSYTRIGGVLRRQRIDAIALPLNQSVQLQPGGFHVLLVGLKGPLIANTVFRLWLEFDGAGGFEVDVQVVRPGAGWPCGPTRGVPAGPPPPWVPKGSY